MNSILLNRSQRWGLVILAVGLGFLFAVGFVPTATHYGNIIATWLKLPRLAGAIAPFWAGPLLAVFFYVSLNPWAAPKNSQAPDWGFAGRISVLPVGVALAFGFLEREILGPAPLLSNELVWSLISIPLLEEFLFRGWMFELSRRLFGRKEFTATNPLSCAIWMSAIAFSLWHFQNLGLQPTSLMVFQIGYTFFAGIWLGLLRERTQSLWPCLLGHAAANAATLFPRIL